MQGRSVQTAALSAGVAGLIAMILLSYLFVSGDVLVDLVQNHRSEAVGLPLAFLLLITVGGYGLLSFYGFRLRSLWAQRNKPSLTIRRHDPGRLALSDLRKIRFLSVATLLAMLLVYLVPRNQPTLLADSSVSGDWDSDPQWWRSSAAMKTIVMVWTIGAAIVVLLARRAAWDIAAAAGNLSGPDDVRAFQVVQTGTASHASNPSSLTVPVAAIPLTATNSQITTLHSTAVTTTDFRGPRPSYGHAGAPPDAVDSSVDRAAMAEALSGHRDWETVLLALLVLLLLLCIGMTDATRPMRQFFMEPRILKEVYDRAQVGFTWSAFGTRTGTVEPSAIRGVSAVLFVACELFICTMAVIGILWSTLCLMRGPFLRRPAILLMALTAMAGVYGSIASEYFNVHFGVERLQRTRISWLSQGNPSIDFGVFETRLQLVILPVALLVVLTRPAVHALFDLRIRKPEKDRMP